MSRNWVYDSVLSFYIAEANGIFYLDTLYLHFSSFVFRKSRAKSTTKRRTDHVIRKLYFCSGTITSLYSESVNLLARKPPIVGVHNNTSSGTEEQIPRCRLTLQRYISVPRFAISLVNSISCILLSYPLVTLM